MQEENVGPSKVTGFADDSSMSFAGPDQGTVQQVAQYTVPKIVEYGKDLGIAFDSGKTDVMHFGKDPEPGFDLKELIMNGQSIPYSEEVTYLGMKLNRKLDWQPHVDAKIKVATQVFPVILTRGQNKKKCPNKSWAVFKYLWVGKV